MQVLDVNVQGQASNSMPVPMAKAELPVKQAAEDTKSKSDAVKISAVAQARLLYQQGFSVSEIAIKMNLDAKTVSTYLGSQTNAATTAPSSGPTQQTKGTNAPQGDTVKVSSAAKALYQKQQGNTVPQIVFKTGLGTESAKSSPGKTL